MKRFEIVRVDGGWFTRLWAANNRIVWVTPGLYTRRRSAEKAVELFGDPDWRRGYLCWLTTKHEVIAVRYVDERSGV